VTKFEVLQVLVWLIGGAFQAILFGFFFGKTAQKVNSMDTRVSRIESFFDQELLQKSQSAGR
jgi:hypothetical protein